MSKILMKLAAAAALIFCLTSCDLDFVDNYTLSIGYEFTIEDEDDMKELQEYLDAFVARADMKAEYNQCAYTEAVYEGQQLFTKAIEEELDRDYIMDHIQAEDDIIRMAAILSSDSIREVVSQIYWNWEWKQYQLQFQEIPQE